ncbi:MAG TPA: carboxymuconolactone decarboxylase family protein [Acidimicrobiaceae bacterium]|nr:carboxymuconolactone decarboxylase family protein [Acidimicrobiaceae bacterium]
MAPFLAPVEKPKGLLLRAVYFFTRKQFGKVSTPIAVFSARMPNAFLSFYGKVSRLDKKLELSPHTAVLLRQQVAAINGCAFCMDTSRWYATKKSPEDVARIDALPGYRSSPLFSDAERAALDYAIEVTATKRVDGETFARLAGHYSEREICDIVWLVASEHVYNMTNHALNIGSDGLCEIPDRRARTSTPVHAAG